LELELNNEEVPKGELYLNNLILILEVKEPLSLKEESNKEESNERLRDKKCLALLF
jgi:hypothetical protein